MNNPEFEAYWEANKVEFGVGILTEAFKEIALKAWNAGAAATEAKITKSMRKLNGWKD